MQPPRGDGVGDGVATGSRVGVLGPVRVEVSGVERPITARRQRAVLAYLALHAGEAVSADRLLDEVWGDEQPDSGVRAVAYQISKLRSLLEPDRAGAGSADHDHDGRISAPRWNPTRSTCTSSIASSTSHEMPCRPIRPLVKP